MRIPILAAAYCVGAVLLAGCAGHSAEHDHHHDHNHGQHQEHSHEHEHAAASSGEHAAHDHDHAAHEQGGHAHAGETVLTEQQMQTLNLAFETVQPDVFAPVMRVGGHLVVPPADEHTVVATVDGVVTLSAAASTPGAKVGADQTVAVVSSKRLQDGDDARMAQLAFETVSRELERDEKLAASGVVSVKELEQTRLRYETARVAYEGVSHNLTDQGVRMPAGIPGVVQRLLVRQGDYVQMGAPIAIIARQGRLQLRADVPAGGYAFLAQVDGAHFKVAGSDAVYRLDELNGRLLACGQVLQEGSSYLPVTFELDNRGTFPAGAFAEVYLLGKPAGSVISVPLAALTEEQGVYFVYVRVPDEPGAFLKTEVSVGMNNGIRAEILSGLHAGDQVVARGAYQLKLASASAVIPEGHHHH